MKGERRHTTVPVVPLPSSATLRWSLVNALRLSAPELQTGFEAAHALEVHFERCPLGGMISIQDGARSWHTDSDCPELYVSGREIQNRVPCPFCAQTPRDPDDLNAGLRVIHAPDGVQLENLRPLQTNSSPVEMRAMHSSHFMGQMFQLMPPIPSHWIKGGT